LRLKSLFRPSDKVSMAMLVALLTGAMGLAVVTPVATASAAKLTAHSSLPPGGGGTQGKKVVLLTYPATNQWAGYNTEVFDAQMKNLGITVQGEYTDSPTTQVSQFREAIDEHPAVIAIEILSDAAITPAIRQAYAAKVPVVVFDGPTSASVSNEVRTVLSNNSELGTFAAENMVQGLQSIGVKSGDYAILAGLESMLITTERQHSFFAYMKKYPQYKDVATDDAQWLSTVAATDATELFAKYGSSLKAVYGMADYLAVPAIQAAQTAGFKPGKNVIIAGGNCFKAGIQAVKAGTYYGTATEDPGTVAMKTARIRPSTSSSPSIGLRRPTWRSTPRSAHTPKTSRG
jgi:ABC-type sugar transport system substrate-binding protein